MDKPVTLSVKHWIIRKMSVNNQIQENIIETIVNHQFESALIAFDTCNSLEFSGFGKFFFNRPKALKKMEKYKSQLLEFTRIIEDPSTTDIRRRNIMLKRETTIKNFEYLNKKLNEHIPNLRGMEKQDVPPETFEGVDSESEAREDRHL